LAERRFFHLNSSKQMLWTGGDSAAIENAIGKMWRWDPANRTGCGNVWWLDPRSPAFSTREYYIKTHDGVANDQMRWHRDRVGMFGFMATSLRRKRNCVCKQFTYHVPVS